MTFADAFNKKADGLKKIGIELPQSKVSPPSKKRQQVYIESIPMMYRAQIRGRCSLNNANDNQDLTDWTNEWVYPRKDGQPRYQYLDIAESSDSSIYRCEIPFPFRVLTDCGQDSILRPVLGKNGMPFIPGSSIKGLFLRLLQLPNKNQEDRHRSEKVKQYCGDQDNQGLLRFHGAYPIGDWAGTEHISQGKYDYRMVDVLHPQQDRQVKGWGTPMAIPLVSLYKPTLLFELSSINPLDENEWTYIKGLLKRALRQGIGGKTSTGYGLYALPKDSYELSIQLQGMGVSSLLRSDLSEFRPNIFKASLRGHFNRLLGGVCSDEAKLNGIVNHLFGGTKEPGLIEIYWLQDNKKSETKSLQEVTEKTKIYDVSGILYLDIKYNKDKDKDLELIKLVIQFAYFMGGFGKSWRRVWHLKFFPSYTTRAIGCHWIAEFLNDEAFGVKDTETLGEFLKKTYGTCQSYVNTTTDQFIEWKEAWHPDRVAVYSKVVQKSEVIELFHDPVFKYTPAIGGRELGDDDKPPTGKEPPTAVSSVWHRMLPLDDDGKEYLEIVTIFHKDRFSWKYRKTEDQLFNFINKLTDKKFTCSWGSKPAENP